MRRRSYLAGCVGLAGGLAGCTGVLDGSDDSGSDENGSDADDGGESGSSGDGPAATIEALYEAFLDGDAETARSYYHPDAETSPPREEDVQEVPEGTLRLEGTTVVEQGSEEATVEATISEELSSGERGTGTRVFVLRKVDGEWKIYDRPQAGTRPPAVPQVSWDSSARTADGAVTAVEFQHAGGDNVDSSTLGATVAGATVSPSDAESEIAAGSVVVIPLDSSGDPVESGETVELVWKDPDGDSSLTVAAHTLESDTTGSPAEQLQLEN